MFKVTSIVTTIYTPVPEFISWKLGQEKPHKNCAVVEFRASDEELRHIEQVFRGIPTKNNTKEMIWKGDFAQFIFDNL